MTTALSGVGATTGSSEMTLNKSLASLGSEDFLQMLITQLRTQDPTNPMDNKEILQQLSSLRTLEANMQLVEAIEDLTLKQQVGTGAALLGREVLAVGDGGARVAGLVTGVLVARDGVAIAVAGPSAEETWVPLSNVLEIRQGM